VPVLEEENVVAAYCIDLLNLPFMLLFMLIYAFYNSILTLTAFFSRIQTIDLTVKPKDCFKAIMLDWGRIERKKMNI